MFGWTVVSRMDMPLGGRTLYKGMQGCDVVELEKLLRDLGLYFGEIDGIYGELLEEAVADLQKLLILPVDGVFSDSIQRRMRSQTEGSQWIIEDEDGLSERIKIRPAKKIWIWNEDSLSFPDATGHLIRPGFKSSNEGEPLNPYIVVKIADIKTGNAKQITEEHEWIVDLRKEEPRAIRKFLRTMGKHSGVWLWLSDWMVGMAGMVSYLRLKDDQRKWAGIIIELNPERRESVGSPAWKRRIDLFSHLPIMISLNLRPRIDINNEETIISHKEGRICQYQRDGEALRYVGHFQWATRSVRKGEDEGRLWLVDHKTFASICQSVLYNHRMGILLEGLSGGNSRIFKIYQEYFKLENIGHETSIRDIYLKREKCLKR